MRNNPSSPTRVSLRDLPIAELQSRLLDGWIPDRIPLSRIIRAFGLSDLGSRGTVLALGPDWTTVGSITVSLSGKRPVQVCTQMAHVSVPGSTTACFGIGLGDARPSSTYGGAALDSSGPLNMLSLFTTDDGIIDGSQTFVLYGRSLGAGGASVDLNPTSYEAKVWAYEL